MPHLQTVLEKGSAGFDAVWRLKQFVLSERNLPYSTVIVNAVHFFNCRNAIERLELEKVYKQLLIGSNAVDPMDLPSSCANNNVYELQVA
jgi:hypothetical protein